MYNLKYLSNNGKSINFSPSLNLAITNTEGLTSNYIEMSTSQGINQVGTTIQGQSVGDRTITIDGTIIGESVLYRKQLIDTITPLVGGQLIFDNKFYLTVVPENTPDISRHGVSANFQFILRAAYPYWRATSQSATSLSGMVAKFRFPVNYGNPSTPDYHIFGQRITLSYQNVINNGNVPVPFVVKFHAVTALSNPKIVNMKTLQFIRINKSMVAGETITIDMMEGSLTITSDENGVDESIFGYFDIDSQIFKLQVGDNLIRVDADENRDGLDCTIYHYMTSAGAYGDDATYK